MTSTIFRRTPPREVEGADRVPWQQLGPEFIAQWGRPGDRFDPEHLTIYGKSGGGKSAFLGWAVQARNRMRGSHSVIVATKPTDRTISALGWPVIDRWPPSYGQTCVVYWAKAKGISAESLGPQRVKVKTLMDALWRPNSNVVVCWDELTYLENDLRLSRELRTFYREGRALGITNVASMQRPAGVSRLAHSEAGWTVAFPPKDVDDRKRVAEVLGDRARFMILLDQLDRARHEFLIRHDLTGAVYISSLPPSWVPGRSVSRGRGQGVPSGQR